VSERLRPFEYALLRVVPRVDRGETINAGVLVHCHALDYLGCRIHLDTARLHALDRTTDPVPIEQALRGIEAVCAGTSHAGPAAHEDIGRRFRWLTAPRSTVVQPGSVHTGLTSAPDAEADHLLRTLVLPPT
jgi:hypothetical protein